MTFNKWDGLLLDHKRQEVVLWKLCVCGKNLFRKSYSALSVLHSKNNIKKPNQIFNLIYQNKVRVRIGSVLRLRLELRPKPGPVCNSKAFRLGIVLRLVLTKLKGNYVLTR